MSEMGEDPAVCREVVPGTWLASCRACFLECDSTGRDAPDARGHLPCPKELRVFAAENAEVPRKRRHKLRRG